MTSTWIIYFAIFVFFFSIKCHTTEHFHGLQQQPLFHLIAMTIDIYEKTELLIREATLGSVPKRGHSILQL